MTLPDWFGAKLDVSLYDRGMACNERMSFDAYNESDILKQKVENYKARIGLYPERVMVDQIYRTRVNLTYCKILKIRVSEPALGRPTKDAKDDKKLSAKTIWITSQFKGHSPMWSIVTDWNWWSPKTNEVKQQEVPLRYLS